MITTNVVVRLTKSQKFEAIASYMESMDSEAEVGGIPAAVLAKAMRHELELLAKKNAGTGERKRTATQEANAVVRGDIVTYMVEGERYTVTDLMKLVPSMAEFSNQKATALVRQLVLNGELVKTTEKGKSYFSLAD